MSNLEPNLPSSSTMTSPFPRQMRGTLSGREHSVDSFSQEEINKYVPESTHNGKDEKWEENNK